MKHHRGAATWKPLLLLILFILGSSASNAAVSLQRTQHNNLDGGLSRSSSRSLLSQPPPSDVDSQRSTYFVATPQEKLELRNTTSDALIYAVDLGAPLYSSYQAHMAKANGGFYLDTDEHGHGQLCMVSNGIRQNIHKHIAEFVHMTPYALDDGVVTHGSKNTTTLVIDAMTGRIINAYPLSRGEEQGVRPMSPNSAGRQLLIMLTEYKVTAFSPNSNEVVWNLTYTDVTVISTCSDIESLVSGALGSEAGGDIVLPLSCQSKIRVRHQNRLSIQPSTHGRLLEEQNTDKVLSDPISNALHVVRRSHKGELVMLFDWSPVWTLTFSFVILLGFVIYGYAYVAKRQALSNSSPSKRKKSRKSGKNASGTSEKKEKNVSSQDEEALANSEGDNKTLLLDKLFYGAAVGRRIGKLLISNTEIAKGSNGTIVLEGVYEGRPVAVKRLVLAHHDVAFKEIQNLIASDRHQNIVRWYGVEYDQDFVYLSLERCICNLDDLVQIYSKSAQNPVAGDEYAMIQNKVRLSAIKAAMPNVNLWKQNDLVSPQLLKLMRDVVCGLVHLHELGIIHRDLKPQNVLLINESSLCAKLSDMGISKRLIGDMSSLGLHATGKGCGSSGWQAPEQLLHGRQTRAVDLFSLGCVLFFCITGGRHPFGDRLERDINIVKNQMDLFLVEYIPEALNLISRLLNRDPELRPKALEVLNHPLFWSSDTRLSFLRDYSDRVELEDREANSDLLKALENTAPVALGGKWNEKMEPAFLTNIGHYRRYKFDSVRDLLRVMRNKSNHYRELPKEIQELLGPVPEGYDHYFASRFPKLLIEVYKVACEHCKEEEWFQKYFRSTANESSGL